MPASAPSDVEAQIDLAVDLLRRGQVVGLPTETVYGLAADATNEEAVGAIFAIKGRPLGHPLIVHLGGIDQLDQWAVDIPDCAYTLADRCWPGPLTLLLPRAAHVLDIVTGGRDTVGIRVPAHAVTQAVLSRFGRGLAAPSANRFGRVSPTTADHVRADLGADVAMVLDGGDCAVGVESTIIDCTTPVPQVLRPGGIAIEDLDDILCGNLHPTSTGPRRAPGMLASHYAPRCQVIVVPDAATAQVAASTDRRRSRVIGTDVGAADYARSLYSWLRAADHDGIEVVFAVQPAASGLGFAIRDRIARAATVAD